MPMQENREREMGRPRMEEARCKRHPKHQQSKGVCPFCLRERLSGLLAGSSSGAYSSSSSVSSSPYSSEYSDLSSSAITPPYLHDLKRASLSLLFKARTTHGARLVGISEPLTKSRSLASALLGNRRKEDKKGKEKEEKEKGTDKKKERRFWSKLFGGLWRSSKAGGVSLHSRTVKEKSALFV